MEKHHESVLLNTIESMATDADDRGESSFTIRLSVQDAFEICRIISDQRIKDNYFERMTEAEATVESFKKLFKVIGREYKRLIGEELNFENG